jgi:hypothetical protein
VHRITSSAKTPSSCFSLIVVLLTMGAPLRTVCDLAPYAPDRLEEILPGPVAPTTTETGELHLGTAWKSLLRYCP